MQHRWTRLLVAVVLLGPPAAVSAQLPPAPESPMLLPPRPVPGLGLYLLDTENGGIGVLGAWRGQGNNWGLRLGLADDSDDLGVFGGIDFVGGIHRETRDLPIDLDWLVGAFLSVGDNLLISAPVGLTGAHTFLTEGASFTPFFTPRLVLDIAFFEDAVTGEDESDADLDFAADLGLDLRLSGFRPVIRFAASVGRDAIGIGLVFPSGEPRRAAR